MTGRRFKGLGVLPKARFAGSDEAAFAKVRAMIRAGRSDAEVSDYLGMVEDQVAQIRANMRESRQGRPPSVPSGPGDSGDTYQRARKLDGEFGSAALLGAIDRLQRGAR